MNKHQKIIQGLILLLIPIVFAFLGYKFGTAFLGNSAPAAGDDWSVMHIMPLLVCLATVVAVSFLFRHFKKK